MNLRAIIGITKYAGAAGFLDTLKQTAGDTWSGAQNGDPRSMAILGSLAGAGGGALLGGLAGGEHPWRSALLGGLLGGGAGGAAGAYGNNIMDFFQEHGPKERGRAVPPPSKVSPSSPFNAGAFGVGAGIGGVGGAALGMRSGAGRASEQILDGATGKVLGGGRGKFGLLGGIGGGILGGLGLEAGKNWWDRSNAESRPKPPTDWGMLLREGGRTGAEIGAGGIGGGMLGRALTSSRLGRNVGAIGGAAMGTVPAMYRNYLRNNPADTIYDGPDPYKESSLRTFRVAQLSAIKEAMAAEKDEAEPDPKKKKKPSAGRDLAVAGGGAAAALGGSVGLMALLDALKEKAPEIDYKALEKAENLSSVATAAKVGGGLGAGGGGLAALMHTSPKVRIPGQALRGVGGALAGALAGAGVGAFGMMGGIGMSPPKYR
jgi:hypothetical protein